MIDEHHNEGHSRQSTELLQRFSTLRMEVRSVLDSAGLTNCTASELGRILKIDKTLAWRVHRVAFAIDGDLSRALSAVPGLRGWDLVRVGLFEHGANRKSVGQLVTAVVAFHSHLDVHPLSRRVLAADVSAATRQLSSVHGAPEVLALRRAGTEARMTALGISEAVGISSFLIAPSPQPGMVGVAALRVRDRLTQLRPRPPANIYISMITWKDGQLVDGGYRPLDPSTSSTALIQDLSTERVLGNEIKIADKPRRVGEDFEFVGHVGGNNRSIRACFGEVAPVLASAYATTDGERAELGFPLELPRHLALFDIFLHRDVPMVGEIALRMHSTENALYGHRYFRAQTELPPETTLRKLSQSDEDIDLTTQLTEHLRDSTETAESLCGVYRELRQRAAVALQFSLNDFSLYRAVIAYPTTPSTLIASWPLPARDCKS